MKNVIKLCRMVNSGEMSVPVPLPSLFSGSELTINFPTKGEFAFFPDHLADPWFGLKGASFGVPPAESILKVGKHLLGLRRDDGHCGNYECQQRC